MAKGADPDQTAKEQSDLGLHCLPRPEYVSKNLGSLKFSNW